MSPEATRPLRWRYATVALLGTDILMLSVALLAAYLIRYRAGFFTDKGGYDELGGFLCYFAWVAALALNGSYVATYVGSGFDEYRRVAAACTEALVAVVVITYAMAGVVTVSRGFLVITWLLSLVTIITGRLAVRRLLRLLARRGVVLRRVLVIGANEQGIRIAHALQSQEAASSVVIGFLDDYRSVASKAGGIEVLGDPLHLDEVVDRLSVTHVVAVEGALSWESRRAITRAMHRRRRPQVLLAAGSADVSATSMQLVLFGNTLLLEPHASRVIGVEAFLKRSLDLAIAVPAAVCSLPLQLGLLFWSGLGPDRTAFRWRRVMLSYGRTAQIPSFSSKLLASLHLSRLPELWWVIAGMMSLVGPRPIEVEEADQYDAWQEVFTALKPGVVGPSWLAGSMRPTDRAEEIAVDLRYAQTYTLWQDLRVLLGVAAAVLTGQIRLGPEARREMRGHFPGLRPSRQSDSE